jgi:hypothetical protein
MLEIGWRVGASATVERTDPDAESTSINLEWFDNATNEHLNVPRENVIALTTSLDDGLLILH